MVAAIRSALSVFPSSSAVRVTRQPILSGSCISYRRKSTNSPAFAPSIAHGDGQFINIVEVGPRDGLQNISGDPVPTATKLELIRRLFRSGVKVMEVGSFVRADRVPQMADTPQLLPQLRDMPEAQAKGVHLPVLIPNMRGLDNLLKLEEAHSGGGSERLTDEISVFVPASDPFCKANNGTAVQALLDSLPAVISKAIKHGYRVRGYVSVVMTDPYVGKVPLDAVRRVTAALDHMGCYEMSLGDTTGEGDPLRWVEMWEGIKRDGLDMGKIAAHDTFSSALPSITSLLPLGLRTIDSSVAGLGGCPYSPGATGNVATEDVVRLLHSLGYQTGIDLDVLAETGGWVSEQLGRANGSNVGTALCARKRVAGTTGAVV